MLRAVIFDFDGVIADTEPLHLRAFTDLLPTGVQAPDEATYFSRYVGLNDATFVRTLFREQGVAIDEADVQRIVAAKHDRYLAMIPNGLPLPPGIEPLIRSLNGRIPMAICSGARRIEIEAVLRAAKLLDYFPTIVSVDEVPISKPDPAGFLAAHRALGERLPDLRPGECVAIEDSAQGVKAGKAAGMRVVAIAHRTPAELLAAADVVLDSHERVELSVLERTCRDD
jgi:beta-phosphoglucomutase